MALTILAERQDGLLILTLNRPDKRNALNTEMYQALADTLRQAAQDENVHVLLLQGQPDCFTAGNDLADFMGKETLEADDPILQFLHTLADFPKPVVAAVGGAAVGIGTTLLLHCDLVYLGENARLQLPFVELGLVPEFASRSRRRRCKRARHCSSRSSGRRCTSSSMWRRAPSPLPCRGKRRRAALPPGSGARASRPPPGGQLRRNRPISSQPCTLSCTWMSLAISGLG